VTGGIAAKVQALHRAVHIEKSGVAVTASIAGSGGLKEVIDAIAAIGPPSSSNESAWIRVAGTHFV